MTYSPLHHAHTTTFLALDGAAHALWTQQAACFSYACAIGHLSQFDVQLYPWFSLLFPLLLEHEILFKAQPLQASLVMTTP